LAATTLAGLLLAAIAAAMDLRWRRIPNWFSYATIISGVLVAAVYWPTPWTGVFAWIVTMLGALALFAGGRMGGGDVKMLAGLGLWIPHPIWANSLLWGLLVGAAVSFALLASRLGVMGAATWLEVTRRQLATGNLGALSDGARLPLLVFVAAGLLIAAVAPQWSPIR
jgi:prepilin peptidase CpaA